MAGEKYSLLLLFLTRARVKDDQFFLYNLSRLPVYTTDITRVLLSIATLGVKCFRFFTIYRKIIFVFTHWNIWHFFSGLFAEHVGEKDTFAKEKKIVIKIFFRCLTLISHIFIAFNSSTSAKVICFCFLFRFIRLALRG